MRPISLACLALLGAAACSSSEGGSSQPAQAGGSGGSSGNGASSSGAAAGNGGSSAGNGGTSAGSANGGNSGAGASSGGSGGSSAGTPGVGGSGATSSGGSGAAGSGGSGAAGASSGGAAGSGGVAGSGGAGGTGGSGGATGGSAGTGGSSAQMVKLVAFGDAGEGNQDAKDVAKAASDRCELAGGCDAALMLGDNFYDDGVDSVSDPLWITHFEDVYDQPSLNGLTFYSILGNHDYGLTSSGDAQAQIDYSFLPVGSGNGMRRTDKWLMPSKWYDVQIGQVHLFALDTQDNLGGQGADMAARVTSSSARWKLVIGHHPRYTRGSHNKDNWLIPGMFNMQKQVYCAADLYLAGHDHNSQFVNKGRDSGCLDTYFGVSGAASKTSDFESESNFLFRPQDAPGASELFANDEIEAFTFLAFSTDAMLVEYISKEGTVLFSQSFSK